MLSTPHCISRARLSACKGSSRSFARRFPRCSVVSSVQSTTAERAEEQAQEVPQEQPAWKKHVTSYKCPDDLTRVQAPAACPPVVILPGFGNCSEDYSSPFGNSEASISAQLIERGFEVHIVPVERKDWLKVAKGILSLDFWKGQLTTHPSYSWYLQRVRSTVQTALSNSESSQVVLIGHSAGGWLARAFTGDPQWFVDSSSCTPDSLTMRARMAHDPSQGAEVAAAISADSDTNEVAGLRQASLDEDDVGLVEALPGTCSPTPNPAVAAIVTLGSPQRPPINGRDVTGGAQGWVDTNFPGAFYKDAGVEYVCVCGKTVEGVKRGGTIWNREDPSPPSYAFNSYEQVCGEGSTVGDAVVPLQSAFLDGADCMELPGVFHSMSRLGTYSEASEYPWYGSSQVVDRWLSPLVSKLKMR